MTDLAHFITTKIWCESVSGKSCKVFFSVGCINAINPYATASIKFETLVYCYSVPAVGECGPMHDIIPTLRVWVLLRLGLLPFSMSLPLALVLSGFIQISHLPVCCHSKNSILKTHDQG